MEITKREVAVSTIFVAIWMILGIFIGEKINTWQQEKNAEYDKAVKITNQELFEHGIKTSLGNAFVYGKLEAADAVTFPELKGEYSYITKVKEKHTMHTRVVTYTTGTGTSRQTHTRTEVCYTWDEVERESKKTNTVLFLGCELASDKVELPEAECTEVIKESSEIRYKYYTIPSSMTGTLYADLKNGTIKEKGKFYVGKTIEETVEDLEMLNTEFAFWVVWSCSAIAFIAIFYYAENNWLKEGDKNVKRN